MYFLFSRIILEQKNVSLLAEYSSARVWNWMDVTKGQVALVDATSTPIAKLHACSRSNSGSSVAVAVLLVGCELVFPILMLLILEVVIDPTTAAAVTSSSKRWVLASIVDETKNWTETSMAVTRKCHTRVICQSLGPVPHSNTHTSIIQSRRSLGDCRLE